MLGHGPHFLVKSSRQTVCVLLRVMMCACFMHHWSMDITPCLCVCLLKHTCSWRLREKAWPWLTAQAMPECHITLRGCICAASYFCTVLLIQDDPWTFSKVLETTMRNHRNDPWNVSLYFELPVKSLMEQTSFNNGQADKNNLILNIVSIQYTCALYILVVEAPPLGDCRFLALNEYCEVCKYLHESHAYDYWIGLTNTVKHIASNGTLMREKLQGNCFINVIDPIKQIH